MEKKLVLVGVENYAIAKEFLNEAGKALMQAGLRVSIPVERRMTLITPNVEIRIIYNPEYQQIKGLRVDAVFGLGPYVEPLYAYLKSGSRKTHTMGLVEWVVIAEEEAKKYEAYERDLAATREVVTHYEKMYRKIPGIERVHFSGPVTCVIWDDGTKTLIRCGENDTPDPEKGLAMAIAKRVFGTNESGSNYYNIFKKWLPKPETPKAVDETPAETTVDVMPETFPETEDEISEEPFCAECAVTYDE